MHKADPTATIYTHQLRFLTVWRQERQRRRVAEEQDTGARLSSTPGRRGTKLSDLAYLACLDPDQLHDYGFGLSYYIAHFDEVEKYVVKGYELG